MTSKLKPWLIWALPLIFFVMQFIGRSSIGLVEKEITAKFMITASDFGALAAIYYISYAGLQIPFGLLIDNFAVNRVLFAFMICYAIGLFIFATTSYWPLMLFARFLLGLGSIAGFLGAAKIIRIVFSNKDYSFFIALTFSVGFFGAIAGGTPSSILISNVGWQDFYLLQALVAVILAFAVLAFAPKAKNDGVKLRKLIANLKLSVQEVIINKAIIFYALAGGLMMGSIEGIADAWGTPFFKVRFGLSSEQASFASSMIFFGLCVGGPFLTRYADNLAKQRRLIYMCCAGMIFSVLAMLFLPLNHVTLSALCFFCGVCNSYQILVFAINNSLVKKDLAGITSAVTNSIIMSFGTLFHMLIGRTTDFFWHGEYVDGVKLYQASDYQYGLLVVPILASVGALVMMVAKRRRS